MRYKFEVENCDKFFENLKKCEAFTCEDTMSGLSVKYKAIFTILAKPKINLIKKSDTEIVVNLLPSILLNIVSVLFTAIFWAIGSYAIIFNKFSLPVWILIFLIPSIIWILQIVFYKVIKKEINEEFDKVNKSK